MKTLYNLAALLLLSSTLQAAPDYYVKTTQVGNGSGQNWANATDLKTALSLVQAGEEIWMWQGEYLVEDLVSGSGCNAFSYIVPADVSIYGSFSNTNQGVNDRDLANYSSVISADANSNGVVDDDERVTLFTILPTTSDPVILDGIDFELAAQAIDASTATVELIHCSFVDFDTERPVIESREGELSFEQCLFEDNTLHRMATLIELTESDATFNRCSFRENETTGRASFGACVAIATDCDLDFTSSEFYKNSCAKPSEAEDPTPTSTLDLDNCTFHDNTTLSLGSFEFFSSINVRNSIVFDEVMLDHLDDLSSSLSVSYSVMETSGSCVNNNICTWNNADFVDATAGDLDLVQTAAAINQGNNTWVSNGTFDLAGTHRIAMEAVSGSCIVDMGAYEYNGGDCQLYWKGSIEAPEPPAPLFGLYPNPTNGQVRLALEEPTSGRLWVYSISGELVLEQTIQEQQFVDVDASGWANGLYLVRLESGANYWTETLVKSQ